MPAVTLLLRHGQTSLSVDRRFAGLSDPALSPVGTRQAAACAAALAGRGIDAIVTSPLRRARDTASAVALSTSAPVTVLEALRETDFGSWDGLTFAEASSRWPAAMTEWLADPAVAPPGGEPFTAVAERVLGALPWLLGQFSGKTVVLVSHVTPIKVLVAHALGAPLSSLYRMHLDLACLSRVDWYPDGPAVLRSLNDTTHLAELG